MMTSNCGVCVVRGRRWHQTRMSHALYFPERRTLRCPRVTDGHGTAENRQSVTAHQRAGLVPSSIAGLSRCYGANNGGGQVVHSAPPCCRTRWFGSRPLHDGYRRVPQLCHSAPPLSRISAVVRSGFEQHPVRTRTISRCAGDIPRDQFSLPSDRSCALPPATRGHCMPTEGRAPEIGGGA
jgi:hypothetical protein